MIRDLKKYLNAPKMALQVVYGNKTGDANPKILEHKKNEILVVFKNHPDGMNRG